VLVNTVLILRSKQPPERGWERHARLARVAVWVAIAIGLPATLAGVWTNGASLFCF
jgi:hypothetical protein